MSTLITFKGLLRLGQGLFSGLPWPPLVVCLCCLLTCSVQAQSSRSLGLRAIQTVTGLTQPASSLTSEHVGVNFGGSTAAAPSAAQRQSVADARPMAVSVREYGVGTMTKAEIVQAAKAIMSPAKANQIAAIIRGVMSQGKVGSGVFIYEQQVRPKGSTRDMKLSWGVTVTESGQVFAGDPKVTDPDPTTVYMLYTSLAAEAGLPSTWTYADAGVLKWQLRKRDGTPTTPWVSVNTGGAFDEAEADSEFKVNCLANNTTAGCPTGYVDAQTLIAETASTSAVIDYVRKVAPAYDESQDTTTGETINQPRMAISYDQRNLNRNACSSGTYQNSGRIGYTLKTVIDRYLATESASATRINSFEGYSLSPTQSFNVSTNISNGFNNLSNKLLSPYTQQLLTVADIPGIQYIAPIQITNSSDQAILVTSGSNNVSISQPTTGKYTLDFTGSATGSWDAGATSITLQLNPADFTSFTIDYLRFDWYGAIRINGNQVMMSGETARACSAANIGYGGCFRSWGGWWGTGQQISGPVNILPYLVNGNNTIDLMSIRDRITTARMQATSCMAN